MTAARTGDIAHAFIILNTTVFLAAVLLHAVGYLNVFSEAFQAQGFCIANFTAAVSSHELSFYSDAVFASAIFLLSRPYKSEPSMKPVIRAVPGILGNRGDAVVVFVGEGPMKEQLEGLSVSGFGVRVLTSGLHTSSSKVPGFGFGS